MPASIISVDSNVSANSETPLTNPAAPRRLPQHLRYFYAVITWVRGPVPPIDVAFTPLFGPLQEWPSQVFVKVFKRRRSQVLVLIPYLLLWLLLFVIMVHYSRFADEVDGQAPLHFGCTTSLWAKNNLCGLNGESCLPFSNSSFAFRCPAECRAAGKVFNPRAVGDQVINYQTFVVGGPSPGNVQEGHYGTYRADSFICPAAVHAGVISNRYGGCGVLTRTGESSSFPASKRQGIQSIGFDAQFPSSFTFLDGFKMTACKDLRWHLFAVSIPFTTALSVISPYAAVPFYASFVGIFFHVALASDPPFASNPYELVSRALSRFLPAAFIAHFVWIYVLKRPHSRAPKVERTILYLGGLWIGALNNLTFEKMIPLQRLTPRDLQAQPGARAALAIVIMILIVIAIGQIYYLRISGQMPKMLGLYAAFGSSLGLLAAIPGTSLRIHHYILGLLLLPGCRVLTRPALLYQGLLVGLFINGVARWGYAGIIETYESLMGDGLYFSSVPSFYPAPTITRQNVSISWASPGEDLLDGGSVYGVAGLSVLVNDVERYKWRMDEETSNQGGQFTYPRKVGEKSYVRMAWMLRSGGTMDYTRAGVVEESGEWRPPTGGWS